MSVIIIDGKIYIIKKIINENNINDNENYDNLNYINNK